MMEVTYTLFKDDEVQASYIDTACFSSLFLDSWNTIELRISTVKNTRLYKRRWLNLCVYIEPLIEIIDKSGNTYIRMPRRESDGKTLFILSIIRYLWESTNGYNNLVPATFRILKKFPEMDPLKAIVIASAGIRNPDRGSGHSITDGLPRRLVKINDYKEYGGYTCHDLVGGPSYLESYANRRELYNAKKDIYDVEPIIEHYKLKNLI